MFIDIVWSISILFVKNKFDEIDVTMFYIVGFSHTLIVLRRNQSKSKFVKFFYVIQSYNHLVPKLLSLFTISVDLKPNLVNIFEDARADPFRNCL